ncbi:MAG TPA: spore coat protein [Acholeplasmataceae bacterium]|nr:spore coat protein [Acholeplasmataceae bacterium]
MNNPDAALNILTEQVIATDMLIASKSAILNYASALVETHTKEVRNVLKKQLANAISYHEKLSDYMISNGYYHVENINEQITMDINNANRSLDIQAGN